MGPGTSSNKAPPNTTPGQKVNSGVQGCPLQVHKPCDVDKLVIEVVARDDPPDGEGVKPPIELKLETTRRRRGEVPAGVKSRQAIARLREYDLVIETIGDSAGDDKASGANAPWKRGPFRGLEVDPEDVVKVKNVRGYYHGRECAKQEHSELRFKALTAAPELRGKTEIRERRPGASELAIKDIDLSAPEFPLGNLPAGANITAALELIASLFLATKPKDVEFVAASCGKRAKGDAKAAQPNTDLKGILRIYRRDKWTVGLKIPPLGSYKDTRSADNFRSLGSSSPTGDYSRERSGNVGMISGSSSSSRTGKTTTTAEEVWVGNVGVRETQTTHSQGQGRRTESSTHTSFDRNGGSGSPDYGGTDIRNSKVQQRQQGMPKRDYKAFEDRLSKASGFDIVVARNDREIGGKEFVEFVQKVAAGIQAFGQAIVDIKKFFNKVPQAGWKFEFEVSAFAGMVLVEWAPHQHKAAIAGGRYIPVEYKFKGKISLEIVNVSITLSFGIDVVALGTGLVGKVFGKMSFKASIEREIQMDMLRPTQTFDVASDGVVELGAVVSATVVGYTLADGRLSVNTGLELKGKLEADWQNGRFDLEGVLKRKPILLTGSIQGPWWWGKKRIDPPVQILAGGDLYTFK